MSSYAHIHHQTEVFIFEDTLSEHFKSDEDLYDSPTYKLALRKKDDNTLQFAILGLYRITQGDNLSNQEVYILEAGRVFRITFYEKGADVSNKVFEEAFLLLWSNLKLIAEKKIKPLVKDFNFPSANLDAFHRNLLRHLDLLS